MVEEAPWNFIGGGGYSGYENDIATGNGMIRIGVILGIIGVVAVVAGFATKNGNYKGVNSRINERFCPKCGRVIPFDSRICPYCKNNFEAHNEHDKGKTEEKEDIPKEVNSLKQNVESKKRSKSDKSSREIYCSDCKRTIPDDADICPYCGEKFENSDAKICSSCGAENTANGKFCIECGNKL